MTKKGITTKITKKAFLEAMKKTFGNISQSAKIANISRETPYRWAASDPVFKKDFESTEYNEMFMDAIEAKLKKVGIQDENPTMLIFLAKTKCKSRGYVEKSEIDVNDTTAEKIKELFPSKDENLKSLEKSKL